MILPVRRLNNRFPCLRRSCVAWWLLLVLAVYAAPVVKGQDTLHGKGKAAMIYKPAIPYPRLPDGSQPEGFGIFVCHVDTRTGRVKQKFQSLQVGFHREDED